MYRTMILAIINLLLLLCIFAAIVYLFILLVKALKKFINSSEVRKEKSILRQSLGETLKAERIRLNMTQEFVAEALGVSRQAVSKWENGSSDPSTANLFALAKLFGISLEELIKKME